MASILLTMSECPKPLFMRYLQNLVEKTIRAEGVLEGDRIRCESALIVGPLTDRNGGTSILVSWPDLFVSSPCL